MTLNIIGAGLAGCEAAFAAANLGVNVKLYEMKPKKFTEAHHSTNFAELVCSNSLKAKRLESAAGMLKAEMKRFGSIVMECAEKTEVPAGGALAVDRDLFSAMITEKIKSHPNIEVIEGEVTQIPDGYTIIATGPLTSKALTDEIAKLLGTDYLSFFDAAAPIVTKESIDFNKVFYAARYDRGDSDYINCPFDKAEYEEFYNELISAESAPLKEVDREYFKVYEGCMPVEVMAKRGVDTLRFGPLKPVGLKNPKTGHRPWAVVQLRAENSEGSLYNIVGFQTNLKFGEQKRVFSKIPGLENAEFMRYGVMHRNTFINSPKLLNADFSLKSNPKIFFAGQITGVEGYTESAASGILAGINAVLAMRGKKTLILSKLTMLGSLANYISDESVKDFQPMGANMGVLPPLDVNIRDKAEKYLALANRGMAALEQDIKNMEINL